MSENPFDIIYSNNQQYFGEHPVNLLKDYFSLCDKRGRILDIGIGQGRNARFLLKQGYGVDGIEPSSVAANILKAAVEDEKLDLRIYNIGFEDFACTPRTYSAILLLGLFPVLSENQIHMLAKKTKRWLKKKGLVFVTGFTSKEQNFRPSGKQWIKMDTDSYHDGEGNYRTLLDLDNAMSKFKKFKPIYHYEGLGEVHNHGTDISEQHHIFEFILQKA
ncbi:MAG: methyltransferase domain-containing protein [Bacteroidales bacterium]|nr:methyltransferase domain-containing protein [Bacteroidales bacterium]